MIPQIFPRTGRISGPEVGHGAKPDVPTTDRENEKKKHRVFYEAVDAHARRRLINEESLTCFVQRPERGYTSNTSGYVNFRLLLS